MASLNKLAIRGIRSFDDKSIAVIEFFSPVTVIVGHNGSGKTTIIECLKYATTGDQPPNTRGGAFIHDPKMANEKEVKAQVKLRFHAANGTRMLAVRNLSVTMKKTGGMTMKTLEGILGLADGEKTGKRGVISTKCAEMDTEIPQLLGVSKAVLENVIFCHQEDSYWPLAEPAALKKKFDDIFEATKYTKALDAIRSLRKDKVAELKAEKEKLDSLAREKAHSDKLKGRISDLSAQIAAKRIEHEEMSQDYERKVAANKKFYDSSTKFREIYIKVDSLNNNKKHYQEELDSLKETLQELAGTDEELATRMQNFDEHVMQQKQKRRSQDAVIQDLEDELQQVRASHRQKVNEHGQLTAEAKSHKAVMEEREKLIRELSARYDMKGFDHSPLEREKVVEFISRLTDSQKRQNAETDRLQSEHRRENEEYNAKYRQAHSEREGYKGRKQDLQQRTATLRSNIVRAQRDLDEIESLQSQVTSIEYEIKEKEQRVEHVREEIKTARFEERKREKERKIQQLELQRQTLIDESAALTKLAGVQARYDVKREELRSKETEQKNLISLQNARFRKLIGTDAKAETMEREVSRMHSEKEREYAELEVTSRAASQKVQAIEAMLSSLRKQVQEKSDEIKSLDEKIREGLEPLSESVNISTPQTAMHDAEEQLRAAVEAVTAVEGAGGILDKFRKDAKKSNCCPLCARSMNSQEMQVFDKTVDKLIADTNPASIEYGKEEVSEWERALKQLQITAQYAAAREKLKMVDLPSCQREIAEQEDLLPNAVREAEEVTEKREAVKKDMDELASLRTPASTVSRINHDIAKLKKEVSETEAQLSTTGTLRTSEDVQAELDAVQSEITVANRELSSLMSDKDRQQNALQSHQAALHELQLRLSSLKSDLHAKTTLEARIAEMKKEIEDSSGTLKDLDAKMAQADEAIERLEEEHRVVEQELSGRILQAQRASQELNMSVDKLGNYTKQIERYVKDKRARLLQECTAKIEELDAEIATLSRKLEDARKVLAAIDKEINESAASMANLRDNIRARKLVKDIAATQAEIDQYDLEEAAKAKRLFEEKYQIEKDKETELQSRVAHIAGEISSLEAQLKTLQSDMKEFKEVNRRYRDQLIKVKLSDMANNDLEKYAKALDSAIMKYHSLKMEEVNDTMRHLWNKTYQGTDIDGIKISSDSEGGTGARRSYNYRVVMTKDQVEMDMRGRCSAGQKMLASIVIRLALADSFGQNCGILALDEPTNALDTDNIDALAASLVDIINERKNHANFQLIIITHDENFLRKLGQSDVMEYYWRVSRDSRQKSIIERHRFG